MPDIEWKLRIENAYKERILAALRTHVKVDSNGLGAFLDTSQKTSRSERAAAQRAVEQNVTINVDKLSRELRALYADAAGRGISTALDEMTKGGVQVASNFLEWGKGINWDNWTPGSVRIADVAGPRISATLKATDSLANDIASTTLDRIATQIANGIVLGSSWREVSPAISAIIDDPGRADIIATTETNRAYNEATLDSYSSSGIDNWTWTAYDGACDECEALDNQQFTLDDDPPPAHPDCRCGVEPVLPDFNTSNS